jgi:hypothetical protein
LAVTSAERPLSEQDIALIREITRYTPKLAVLLTKVDLLTENQVREVMDFIVYQLRSQLGMTFPVYSYSVRQGLSAYQQRLREELLIPLARKRSETVVEITKHKVNTLVAECIGYLDVGLAAARAEEDRRHRLKAQVLGEQNQLVATLDELRVLVSDCMSHTHSWVMGVLEPHRGELHEKLRADLLSKLPEWRMNLWQLCRSYEAWLEEVLGREVATISTREEEAILGSLRQAESRINRHVENFRARLADNLEKALGVRMSAMRWEVRVRTPGRPDVSVTPSFDIHIDLLWFLIPMWLFGPLVRRHFIRGLPWEAEKNLARLAAQWTEKVNKKVMELESQAEALIKGEIVTVGTLLAQQPDKAFALETARNELARMKEGLSGQESCR